MEKASKYKVKVIDVTTKVKESARKWEYAENPVPYIEDLKDIFGEDLSKVISLHASYKMSKPLLPSSVTHENPPPPSETSLPKQLPLDNVRTLSLSETKFIISSFDLGFPCIYVFELVEGRWNFKKFQLEISEDNKVISFDSGDSSMKMISKQEFVLTLDAKTVFVSIVITFPDDFVFEINKKLREMVQELKNTQRRRSTRVKRKYAEIDIYAQPLYAFCFANPFGYVMPVTDGFLYLDKHDGSNYFFLQKFDIYEQKSHPVPIGYIDGPPSHRSSVLLENKVFFPDDQAFKIYPGQPDCIFVANVFVMGGHYNRYHITLMLYDPDNEIIVAFPVINTIKNKVVNYEFTEPHFVNETELIQWNEEGKKRNIYVCRFRDTNNPVEVIDKIMDPGIDAFNDPLTYQILDPFSIELYKTKRYNGSEITWPAVDNVLRKCGSMYVIKRQDKDTGAALWDGPFRYTFNIHPNSIIFLKTRDDKSAESAVLWMPTSKTASNLYIMNWSNMFMKTRINPRIGAPIAGKRGTFQNRIVEVDGAPSDITQTQDPIAEELKNNLIPKFNVMFK